jgi:hypothetical protein
VTHTPADEVAGATNHSLRAYIQHTNIDIQKSKILTNRIQL